MAVSRRCSLLIVWYRRDPALVRTPNYLSTAAGRRITKKPRLGQAVASEAGYVASILHQTLLELKKF